MIGAKEVFEFLKPDKKGLIISIIIAVIGIFMFWKNMLPEVIMNVPQRHYIILLIITTMGFLIVSYTLTSLIIYLFSGRWKG